MKKNKKNKQQINYLDLIPVRPEKLGWHIDRRERVVLEVKNEGFFNRIAQTYFRRPQTTKVHLDVQGSYLWPLIDGERTVMELAALQKEHFGEAAEPLYPRMVKYFQILESYHFISFKNMEKKLSVLQIFEKPLYRKGSGFLASKSQPYTAVSRNI